MSKNGKSNGTLADPELLQARDRDDNAIIHVGIERKRASATSFHLMRSNEV
jgi:hypothetical protein